MKLNESGSQLPINSNLPDWLQQIVRLGQSILIRPPEPAQPSPHTTPTTAAANPREIEALVIRIYELALRRRPKPDEVQLWTGQVLNHHLSLADLVETISTSPEASTIQQVMPVFEKTDSREENPSEIEGLVVRIYQLALDRTPGPDERKLWTAQVLNNHLSAAGLVETIATSPEADEVRARTQMQPAVPNGRFVQFTYECLLGRGAMADEIAHWDFRLARQNLRRDRLVLSLFNQRATEALSGETPPAAHDPTLAHVMGTDKFIGVKEWEEHAEVVDQEPKPAATKIYSSLAFAPGPEILVSAIASLYRGGEYIHQFLENITSQTIFQSCELIIIDADSPENEYEVIAAYMKRFPNIVYHRAATRIGIYEAWNLGVEMARGRYVTNTNLDDLRRHDSFERQVEILTKFPFVDVVYQDFYYSFEGTASFAKTAAVGIRSQVPVITPYNLMRSNSPHNAPMWRRTLHKEIGLFDASYRSAGDYDFWLRCVQARKVFYKVNDPHVVYFVNPEGLSTQPNTRGIDEANRITQKHGRALISPWLLSSDEMFVKDVSDVLGSPLQLSASDQSVPEWRYTAFQRAMRSCSVQSRGSRPVEE